MVFLEVEYTDDPTCFVKLPQDVVHSLLSGKVEAIISARWNTKLLSKKEEYGQLRESSWLQSLVRHLSPLTSSQFAPVTRQVFFSWISGISTENKISVNRNYAKSIFLPEKLVVDISIWHDMPERASCIVLVTENLGDYELLQNSQDFLECSFLNQLRILSPNTKFPLFLPTGKFVYLSYGQESLQCLSLQTQIMLEPPSISNVQISPMRNFSFIFRVKNLLEDEMTFSESVSSAFSHVALSPRLESVCGPLDVYVDSPYMQKSTRAWFCVGQKFISPTMDMNDNIGKKKSTIEKGAIVDQENVVSFEQWRNTFMRQCLSLLVTVHPMSEDMKKQKNFDKPYLKLKQHVFVHSCFSKILCSLQHSYIRLQPFLYEPSDNSRRKNFFNLGNSTETSCYHSGSSDNSTIKIEIFNKARCFVHASDILHKDILCELVRKELMRHRQQVREPLYQQATLLQVPLEKRYAMIYLFIENSDRPVHREKTMLLYRAPKDVSDISFEIVTYSNDHFYDNPILKDDPSTNSHSVKECRQDILLRMKQFVCQHTQMLSICNCHDTEHTVSRDVTFQSSCLLSNSDISWKKNHCSHLHNNQIGDISQRNSAVLLLYGPKGCGKSSFLHQWRSWMTDEAFYVRILDCTTVVHKRASVIRQEIRKMVMDVLEHSPGVIMMDNIDFLMKRIDSGNNEDSGDGADPIAHEQQDKHEHLAYFLANLLEGNIKEDLEESEDEEMPDKDPHFRGSSNNTHATIFSKNSITFVWTATHPTKIHTALLNYVTDMIDLETWPEASKEEMGTEGKASYMKKIALFYLQKYFSSGSQDMATLIPDLVDYLVTRMDSFVISDVKLVAERLFLEMNKISSSQIASCCQLQQTDELNALCARVLDNYIPLNMPATTSTDQRVKKSNTQNPTVMNQDLDCFDLEKCFTLVAGLSAVKETLYDILLAPFFYPGLYKSASLTKMRLCSHVLLFGVPGSGKTLLADEVAASWRGRVIRVRGPELLNKYVGQSEGAVRALFERARRIKPCLIILEELESLTPQRGQESGVSDRVVNQMLTELDGIEGLTQDVRVLATTARPDLVDSALLRPGRLDRLIHVPLPTKEERAAILQYHSLKYRQVLDFGKADDWTNQVVHRTENYSGADLVALLTNVHLKVVRQVIVSERERNNAENDSVQKSEGVLSKVTMEEILCALNETRPALSVDEYYKYMIRYLPWMDQSLLPWSTAEEEKMVSHQNLYEGTPHKRVTLA